MRLQPGYLLQLGKFGVSKTLGKVKKIITGDSHYADSIRKENGVLIDAASKLGIAVNEHNGGILEFSYQGKSSFLKTNITELDPAISLKLAGDKQLSATLLKRHNLPVPNCKSFHVKEIAEAEAFRQKLGGIVVVKPSRGTSSGTGITAGLSSAKDFSKAFYRASIYDTQILVEEFIEGDNIRLLVIGDRVVSAVKRIPATVIGDGTSTLKQLIDAENQRRKSSREMPRLWPIEQNADMQLTLKRINLTPGSKPNDGEMVQVKTICNGHQGGSVEEVTSRVHPDFNEMAVNAAKALGITFAGVDLITPDISATPDKRSKINEVNTTPSLYGHYLAQNREELRDPAADLLRYIFKIPATPTQVDVQE